jgi:hypothetical protein
MMYKIKGVSGHGKNRVREHGEIWTLVKGESRLRPAQILVESRKTGYMRWMQEVGDKDFEIVEKL